MNMNDFIEVLSDIPVELLSISVEDKVLHEERCVFRRKTHSTQPQLSDTLRNASVTTRAAYWKSGFSCATSGRIPGEGGMQS